MQILGLLRARGKKTKRGSAHTQRFTPAWGWAHTPWERASASPHRSALACGISDPHFFRWQEGHRAIEWQTPNLWEKQPTLTPPKAVPEAGSLPSYRRFGLSFPGGTVAPQLIASTKTCTSALCHPTRLAGEIRKAPYVSRWRNISKLTLWGTWGSALPSLARDPSAQQTPSNTRNPSPGQTPAFPPACRGAPS